MGAQQADSNQFHQHISSALYRQHVHCYILADTQKVTPLPAVYDIIREHVTYDGNQTQNQIIIMFEYLIYCR